MVATATLESCAYYCYKPMVATGGMFAAAFLQATAVHIYQLTASKTKWFFPIIVGGLLEAIGWGSRMISSFESPKFSVIPFAVQYTCILIAPTIMAAGVYMYYEHIVQAVGGQRLSPIRLSRFQKVFLIFDCISTVLLAVGSVMRLMTNLPANWTRLGNRLVMMGLGEQLVFLAIFVFVAGKFQFNIARKPTERLLATSDPKSSRADIPLKRHLIGLYIASAFIAIRTAIRLIENMGGNTGMLRKNETWLVLFDGAIIMNLMFLFTAIHPSEIAAFESFYSSDESDSTRVYFSGWKFWQRKSLGHNYMELQV
ncbi:hypothetical protein DSL72_001086 [Monilinia vaccinii-corymbosi]|uniref:RTA1 domain protein n=1 Tax=Monilinia vaccinii-corymbosi TaxID=61207 RepID=A0A8A3P9X1_9HELO|nr:hypothetical protein DSL72_001086 [Monilinia vaccinii-corymbosi]